MSIQHANLGVVKKGLQLYYNREFSKSFRGEATTNLYSTVGAGALNTYPSAGNSWGTLYDRFYNGGSFFSIGTIASVSSNIITVSSPTSIFNALATFDVIQPQTTGGGVTAGTNYYFKRLSSTTFTLHQWDATNDGSKTPEQILSYINSDTRISVNATSFPTMWWGYPHIPNSALIKTAITNGFAYDNRYHDCLRLYFFRSDTRDAMAYNVYPAYLANQQYTVSMYVKASSQGAIGGRMSISFYFSGTGTGAGSYYSPTLTTSWQRWTLTFTAPGTSGVLYSYLGNDIGTLPLTVDISELQLEQKSYASEFTPTSRSANTVAGGGGLLDISGNNVNADLTNVSFNSSGYTFNGSANYIDLPASTFLDFNLNNFSIFTWINSSATANFGNIFNNFNTAGTLGVQFLTKPSNSGCRVWIGNTSHDNTVNVTNGSWNYIGFVRDGDYVYFYINGSLSSTGTGFAAKNATPDSGNDRRIGRQTTNTAYDFNGQISNFKIYSKALTAAEVLQNFNATRKTYGV